MLRSALLDVWRSRGGGFYGLGYLLAFAYLEIRLLVGDVMESDSVAGFAVAQIAEYLIRVSLLSFVNVFLALLWPVSVLAQFGGAGIILLVAGYLGFEYALKPGLERAFPELRALPEGEEQSQRPDR